MAFINATIFLQIINFYIAFALVKYLFFKPAVALVNDEDKLQETLINTVQQHRLVVAQKEQELGAHWQSAQEYFEQHTPRLRPKPFYSVKPSVIKPHYEAEIVDDLARHAAVQLVQRVSDAR